jgi:hypothetical protein
VTQGSRETKDQLERRDRQELQVPVVHPDKLVKLEAQDNQVHLDQLGQRV